MRDYFSPDVRAADRPQAAAVEAVRAGTLNVSLSSFRVERGDALDQRPVVFVFKDNIVPNFEMFQHIGQSCQQNKIPFFEVGEHRVTGDF